MTHRHSVIAARRMLEPGLSLSVLGTLLWGTSSLATAADITVQPVSGSEFGAKDSSGAIDRLRVQDNGQISLPAVPGAVAQSQSLCIAASGDVTNQSHCHR